MRKLMITLCFMAAIFLSCSKGGNSPSSQNNDPDYVAKWNLTSYVIWSRQGPMFPFHKDTIQGKPGEYLQLTSENQAIECWIVNGQFQINTYAYQVKNGMFLDTDFPDGTTIKVTGSTMELASVDTTSNESFWWFFKK